MFIDDYQKMAMNARCTARNCFQKYLDQYPRCYAFYLTGLITIINFCNECKIFIVSLSDFKLKKVVIAKKICL